MLQERNKLMVGTYDCIFKAIMLDPKNKEFLKEMIHYVTDIPLESLDNMEVVNSEHIISHKKDKKMRSDIIVSIGNKMVSIEMNKSYYRGLFLKNSGYLNKITSGLYNTNENYLDTKESLQINFDKFHYFKNRREIHKFVYKEVETGERLPETSEIYHVDLAFIDEMCYNKPVVNLSRFERGCLLLMAETEEFAKRIAGDDIVMKKVSEKLVDLSKDEVMIGLYDAEVEEEKVRKTQILGAKRDGEIEEKKRIAKNMLNKGMDINVISEITELSIDEINSL